MAGRPIPDATNRSSHIRCPPALQSIRELGLKSCQQVVRGICACTAQSKNSNRRLHRIDHRGAIGQRCDHDLQQDKTKADDACRCAIPPGKHQRHNGEYKRREQQPGRNIAIRAAHFFALSPSSTGGVSSEGCFALLRPSRSALISERSGFYPSSS